MNVLNTLPSNKQIGDDCNLNFFKAGAILNCKVAMIHFTEDKVFYDIEIRINEYKVTYVSMVDATFVD